MNKTDRIKVEKWIKENIGMDSHEIREFRGVRLADLLQLYADEQSREEAVKFHNSRCMVDIDEKELGELYDKWKSKEGE